MPRPAHSVRPILASLVLATALGCGGSDPAPPAAAPSSSEAPEPAAPESDPTPVADAVPPETCPEGDAYCLPLELRVRCEGTTLDPVEWSLPDCGKTLPCAGFREAPVPARDGEPAKPLRVVWRPTADQEPGTLTFRAKPPGCDPAKPGEQCLVREQGSESHEVVVRVTKENAGRVRGTGITRYEAWKDAGGDSGKKERLLWTYDVEFLPDGADEPCTLDPNVCYPGTGGGGQSCGPPF